VTGLPFPVPSASKYKEGTQAEKVETNWKEIHSENYIVRNFVVFFFYTV